MPAKVRQFKQITTQMTQVYTYLPPGNRKKRENQAEKEQKN